MPQWTLNQVAIPETPKGSIRIGLSRHSGEETSRIQIMNSVKEVYLLVRALWLGSHRHATFFTKEGILHLQRDDLGRFSMIHERPGKAFQTFELHSTRDLEGWLNKMELIIQKMH